MGGVKHRLVEVWGLNKRSCEMRMIFPHSHSVDGQVWRLWRLELSVAHVPHSWVTQIEPVSE